MDSLLSLKWNNHNSSFYDALTTLRHKDDFTDVTLACEGEFFNAHKLVLSVCSGFFGELFKWVTEKCPTIVLTNVKVSELELLLDFMYLGEVNVKQEEINSLLKTAESLQMKGLAVPDSTTAGLVNIGKRKKSNDFYTGEKKRLKSDAVPPEYSTGVKNNHEQINDTHTLNKVDDFSDVTIKNEPYEKNIPVAEQNTETLPRKPHISKRIPENSGYEFDQDLRENSQHTEYKQNIDVYNVAHSHLLDTDLVSASNSQSEDTIPEPESEIFYPIDNTIDLSKDGIPYHSHLPSTHMLAEIGAVAPPDLYPVNLPPQSGLYYCNRCSYNTNERSSLNRHKITHMKRKILICHLCNYTTYERTNLNTHARTHTGEKPFSCEFCEYRATTKSSLKRHRLYHHMK